MGKADRINREPKPVHIFKYLTMEQFEMVMPLVEPTIHVTSKTYQALFRILFSSGARTGEAFAFKSHMRIGNKIKIHTQIDRCNKEVVTKNNKRHTTVIFDEAIPDFDYWLTAKDKQHIDRTALSRIWKKACKKAFPENPELWTTVHDLRHGYAVRMMTVAKQNLETIAKLLGDKIAVCEEYYLSFEQNDDLLDSVVRATRLRP